MARRLIDIAFSFLALILLGPLLAVAALGIRLCSPGRVVYRARRVGLQGRIFTMHKFRTMHVDQGLGGSPITAKNDPRVFTFGAWLRRLKIDELPQLWNILRGEMSLVGPRPEDPEIVRKYYTSDHQQTLRVLPGLASPGSIYNYTHGELLLGGDDPEECYVKRLLPVKLALDTVYVREASFVYDLKVLFRTSWVILSIALGRRRFRDPPEMRKARQLGLIPEPPWSVPETPCLPKGQGPQPVDGAVEMSSGDTSCFLSPRAD